MQDEYVKAIEKIQMDKDRKIEMRKALQNELASVQTGVTYTGAKRAKTTKLSAGAKAGIAAAAIAVTMSVVFAIPSSRNAINASIKAFFNKEVPQGAVDGQTKAAEGRKERVVPTDDMKPSEASAVQSQVAAQDKEEDNFYKNVTVKAEYYKDTELNKLANYYDQKSMSLVDLKKDLDNHGLYSQFKTRDWFSDGFYVNYWVGDNATGHSGTITCFKADEKQFESYLKNSHAIVSFELQNHNQAEIPFEKFWKKTTDSEGNTVYTGSWKGPEPEEKILPSDSARFMTFKITYDAKNQIAIAHVEDGGGLG